MKIAIAIFLVFFAFHFIFPSFLSSILLTVARPFWMIGITDSISSSTQNILLSQLQNENDALKQMLGRVPRKNMILAYILKKPPFTAYDSFILDVGEKDGLKIGDNVYAVGNILVGEIAEMTSFTSKVKLYSSYGEKYEVLISEKNVQAIATGRGGGTFETVIPRDVKVSEGDTVIIPNITNEVFGTVGKIIADPARAFSTVIFSQPLNIYEQKWVEVQTEVLPSK